MSKNKSLMILMIIALISMFGVGFGVFSLVNSQKSTIYVFNNSYSAGERLSMDMLTPVKIDKTAIIGGVEKDVSAIYITSSTISEKLKEGQVLLNDVSPYEHLTAATLNKDGGNDIENSVGSGIALTVESDNIRGVTSDLHKGSYVNAIIVTKDATAIFEKLSVLAVQKSEDGNVSGVTLSVTYEQQALLVQALSDGYVQLGLINGTQYQLSTTPQ